MRSHSSKLCTGLKATAVIGAMIGMIGTGYAQNTPVTGAAFTTVNPEEDGYVDENNEPICKNGNPNVNCNIYAGKEFVWLNGGPVAAALGNGEYFFAVVVPSGQGGNNNPNDGTPKNLSDTNPMPWEMGDQNADGSNIPSGDMLLNRRFTIAGGSISYMGSHDFSDNKIRLFPYDDTTNSGGVYIMAICSLAQGLPVTPARCKYDAFKVRAGGTPPHGELHGMKYYDANWNGQRDPGEEGIPNWPIMINDVELATDANGHFSRSPLAGGLYVVREIQANFPWVQSGNTVDQTQSTGNNSMDDLSPFIYTVTVDGGSTTGLNFGNYCRLPTNGKTMGFWSNKNGLAMIDDDDLLALQELDLWTDNGPFNPTTKLAYKNWLLNANATNMAYMLSAQLSALVLSVREGIVAGTGVIFSDGRTVNEIILAAQALLADGYTLSGSPNRAAQEALKNLIDSINNNAELVVPATWRGCPQAEFPQQGEPSS